MLAETRALHRAAGALPGRPDAGEEGEGLLFVDREPGAVFFGLVSSYSQKAIHGSGC